MGSALNPPWHYLGFLHSLLSFAQLFPRLTKFPQFTSVIWGNFVSKIYKILILSNTCLLCSWKSPDMFLFEVGMYICQFDTISNSAVIVCPQENLLGGECLRQAITRRTCWGISRQHFQGIWDISMPRRKVGSTSWARNLRRELASNPYVCRSIFRQRLWRLICVVGSCRRKIAVAFSPDANWFPQ